MPNAGIIASSVVTAGTPVLPVTSGLAFWLDANDDTSFTYATGTEVNQWFDKSGAGNTAARGTTGPNRTAALQNGRPGCTFSTTAMKLTSPFGSGINNLTVFVCAKRTGGGVGTAPNIQSVVTHFGIPSSNGFGLAWRANSANIGLLRAAIAMTSTATAEPTVAGVMSYQRSSGTASMWLNGTATSLADAGSINAASAQTLIPSDTHTFLGDLYEIVAYSTVLNSTDRQSVETYLKSKWGTP